MHRVKFYKTSEGMNLAMFMHNKPNCRMKLIYYIQLYMYQSHGLQKSVKNRVTSISNKKKTAFTTPVMKFLLILY